MKCIKCRVENINCANYCKKCGYHFSEAEQNAAKKWSLVWFLEKIDDIKGIIDLSFITDHLAFKIGSFLAIIGVGIYFFIANGINFKLLESDTYKIQYNTKLKEYYLLAEEDFVKLNLYVPNRAENFVIRHFDKDNQVIEEKEYDDVEEVVLYSNGNDDYYILEVNYEKDDLDKIKLYVYRYLDAEVS